MAERIMDHFSDFCWSYPSANKILQRIMDKDDECNSRFRELHYGNPMEFLLAEVYYNIYAPKFNLDTTSLGDLDLGEVYENLKQRDFLVGILPSSFNNDEDWVGNFPYPIRKLYKPKTS